MGRWDSKDQTINVKKQDLRMMLNLSTLGGAVAGLAITFLSIGYHC